MTPSSRGHSNTSGKRPLAAAAAVDATAVCATRVGKSRYPLIATPTLTRAAYIYVTHIRRQTVSALLGRTQLQSV